MNELPQFIISGLKSIHGITNNIDFKKTTEDYVLAQLKIKMNNQIKTDENFFNFLQKNDKHLKNLKIFCVVPAKEQSLKEHISHHLGILTLNMTVISYSISIFRLLWLRIILIHMGMTSNAKTLKYV